VHRHRGVVVDPDDLFTQRIAAEFGIEAAGGRGALGGLHLFDGPAADAGHGVVAAGVTQQDRRRAEQAALRLENEHARLALVEQHEGTRAVVTTLHDPARKSQRLRAQ